MNKLHVKPLLEIHTTKFHDRHQFLPSRDEVEHIHSQVYGQSPIVQILGGQLFINTYNVAEIVPNSFSGCSHAHLCYIEWFNAQKNASPCFSNNNSYCGSYYSICRKRCLQNICL